MGSQGVAGANGAPGGAITIQYTFSSTTTDSDPGNGVLRLDNFVSQNGATKIRADLLDNLGVDWSNVLLGLTSSTSVVKGQIRLSKKSDQSKFLIFSLSSLASPSGYKNLTVSCFGYSDAAPFADGDVILFDFTRTGDAGSLGVWKGEYNAGTAYITNDIVSYQGSTFICTTGGTGTAPTPATLQTAYSKAAGGRLSLTSGNPAASNDVSGASAATIYYTNYLSDEIGLYTSSRWQLYNFAEPNLSLTGLNTTQPYDIFIFDSAGTLTLEAVAWSNTTTRATALARQDGVLVKSGSANKRFLGTIQLQASGQSEDSMLRRYVFNYYNRIRRPLRAVDATANWTYNTLTWRSANGATTNRVAVVNGNISNIAEMMVHTEVNCTSQNSNGTAAAGTARAVGICADGTTTPTTGCVFTSVNQTTATNPATTAMHAALDHHPDVGLHFYQWVEIAGVTTTTTFIGTAASSVSGLSGITGHVEI